jgi:cytochrome c-type biogenesis protein
MELSLAAAFIAGIVSFLSPCVLPVVPAYLGQLGVVAVATIGPSLASPVPPLTPVTAVVGPGPVETGIPPIATRRPGWGMAGGWRTVPNAIAFVLGFGAVFTFFGLFVYFAAGPLRDNLPLLRQVGGLVLVILGLNLMGVIRLSRLARSWRPMDRPFGSSSGARRQGILGGFTLGSIFAVGWTPCIGPTLGAIIGLSLDAGASPQVIALFVAYSLGLGVPFIAAAVAVDRAPAIIRPLVRHGRVIEIVGGALVVLIGLAMLFDVLALLNQRFGSLVPLV